MITYIVMNIIFPGPYIIYAIGFGWIFLFFLIPIDVIIAGILTKILTRNTEGKYKNIVQMGLFSIALNYIVIGAILGIIGIISIIINYKEYLFDIEAQKYGLIGLITSVISILMSGISIFFISLLIV